ncbi:MAG: family 43 glycosylhydrolase [Marinilabiliaceae bacterium]|nr:family 43 glycosylhydrolase [Marinilabiliaceae bacterium]
MTLKSILTTALGAATLVSCEPNAEKLFENVTPLEGYKALSSHNPIYQQRFGADPYAMVYDGRVYIYMTDDIIEYDDKGEPKNNSYQAIHKINCVSSADLVNWTDHGAMNVAGSDGTCKYARCSWAPTACHKTIDGKEKFFLYFADGGNGIAVATSDSPYGPWTDPRGTGIITRDVPTCNEVPWLFDPAVLIDDDGIGYVYFGGGIPFKPGMTREQAAKNAADPGSARVVRLADNMIELDGEPARINPPYLFEDAGANKINGKYYYSYCTNFNCPSDDPGNGRIAYMTSENPMGPFSFVKTVFNNPGDFFGTGGNNHHAIFEFKGQYYLAYHAQKLQDDMGLKGGYRSTHINAVSIAEDGTINDVIGDLAGVAQLEDFNPYVETEAETMAWMAGISTEYSDSLCTNMIVRNEGKNGAWIGLSGVNFGDKGASSVCFNGEAINGEAGIKIVLDSLDGEVAGYIPLYAGKNKKASLMKTITGKHDIFFIISGDVSLDKWVFTE